MNARFLTVLVLVILATVPGRCSDPNPFAPTPGPGVPVPSRSAGTVTPASPAAPATPPVAPGPTTVVHTIVLRHGPPLGRTPEQFAASGAPSATVFDQGEPIDVAITLDNRGPGAFTFEKTFLGAWPDYWLEVRDAAGKLLEDPRLNEGFGGFEGVITMGSLAPGEKITKHAYLNKWVFPLRPGRYTVVGVYAPGTFFGPARTSPPPPPIRSAPVTIEIRPQTDGQLRARAAALWHAMLSRQADVAAEIAAAAGFYPGLPPDAVPLRNPVALAYQAQALQYLVFTGASNTLPYMIEALYFVDSQEWANAVHYWPTEGFSYYANQPRKVVAELMNALRAHGAADGFDELFWRFSVPHGPTLPWVVRGLSSPNPERRAAAVGLLGGYADEGDAALVPLLGALKDTDPEVRRTAVQCLRTYKDPRALSGLLAATQDPDEDVAWFAVEGLGNRGDPAVPGLRVALRASPRLADQALYSLQEIGTPAAVEAVRYALASTFEGIRLHAAAILFVYGDHSQGGFLAEAIESRLTPTVVPFRSGCANPFVPGSPEEARRWVGYDTIINWLKSALDARHLPWPQGTGSDPQPWSKWLRAQLKPAPAPAPSP